MRKVEAAEPKNNHQDNAARSNVTRRTLHCSLPEGARNVFVLHAVYGYSHDETGEMLGIATGTSKAQLHRAKRLLAQQLKQQGFEA